jgi:hypothetical protein
MTTMTGNATRQRDQSCRTPTRSPYARLYLACWNCSRHSCMKSFEGMDWGRPCTENGPFCEHRYGTARALEPRLTAVLVPEAAKGGYTP